MGNKLLDVRTGININRIVPIIKPIEYLDESRIEAKKMEATKDVDGVYEKYNDQLIIVYVEDADYTGKRGSHLLDFPANDKK